MSEETRDIALDLDTEMAQIAALLRAAEAKRGRAHDARTNSLQTPEGRRARDLLIARYLRTMVRHLKARGRRRHVMPE